LGQEGNEVFRRGGNDASPGLRPALDEATLKV
jgi:hypothetical protein